MMITYLPKFCSTERIGGPLGVRKGAWTEEEDILLRKCIDKFGVGKWHQVPLKAGLNRCRKSCRLRWLNYLRPNIKRGDFAADEVDLMIRLHKLLGNRWSLIAGRLPGRTANDVKNYWNTHLMKKPIICRNEAKIEAEKIKLMEPKIIKPIPRTFTKNLSWLKGKTTVIDNYDQSTLDHILTKPSPTSRLIGFDEALWFESMLVDKETDGGTLLSTSGPDEDPILGLWANQIVQSEKTPSVGFVQGHYDWREFSVDVDLWDFSNN